MESYHSHCCVVLLCLPNRGNLNLHLYPTTVNGHLRTLRALGIIDQENLPLSVAR
jgi:hypothetical protein